MKWKKKQLTACDEVTTFEMLCSGQPLAQSAVQRFVLIKKNILKWSNRNPQIIHAAEI